MKYSCPTVSLSHVQLEDQHGRVEDLSAETFALLRQGFWSAYQAQPGRKVQHADESTENGLLQLIRRYLD
jgi:hypothetical protein